MSTKSKLHLKLRIIRITLCSLLLLWVFGFFYFIYKTEHYVLDNKTITQAIVAFGDNNQTIYAATVLLKFGYAPLVFVAGLEDASYYKKFLKEHDIGDYQLIFDRELVNNRKNYPVDIYLFAKKYGFNSIRLVAPAAWMPRAILEAGKYLPETTVVIAHPVSVKSRNYGNIFIEYNKYLLIMITSILGFQNELNIPYS